MKAKELQKQNDDDLRGWLASSQGRRLFMRLLTQAGLYSPSYAESPTATAYNEGRRSFALNLMQEAQRVCPELYAVALREQLDALVIAKAEPEAAEE